MPTFRTSDPGARADARIPHLILVGLPGAGKTTVGRAVAARLKRPFIDFDEEITEREGMPVTEIFAKKGESYFRGLERQLTEELAGTGGMVVSPGGGWMLNPGVVEMVRPPARLAYLRVEPATALARLGSATGTRPLLNRPDPLEELTRLLARRSAAYESADLRLDSEVLSLQHVIDTLVGAG